MIRLYEITPGLFILQPASAIHCVHDLPGNAAFADKPTATATTAHHSSSLHNLLADFYSVHILRSHSTTATPASPLFKPIFEIILFSFAVES